MRFLIILLIFSISHAESAELHAIFLIDSEAETIETAMVMNYGLWQKQLKKISRNTGLKVHEYAFVGKDLLTSDVIPFLLSLSSKENDVIIFYFCGHGYRTRRKDNQWPYLCFAFENVAVDFGIITEALMKKPSSLFLGLAECCNNYIEAHEEMIPQNRIPLSKSVIKANYQKLFIETRGKILASSSLPGEFSWAWVRRGSCFTLAFLDALDRETRQPGGTDWAIIFETAGRKVQDLQTPQYLINN